MTQKTALGVKISADWGHIKRVDTTSVRQTYRVIPRTTVAGLLAAITGEPRDSYYETFSKENSDISILVTKPIRVQQIPIQHLTTNETALSSTETPADKIVSRESTSEMNRQRIPHEWLVKPEYEIWVDLENTDFYERLKKKLQNGKSVYTPSVGLSECLADAKYLGEKQLTKTQERSVNSTILSSQLESVESVSTERSPAFLEQSGGKRKNDGFQTIVFSQSTLRVNEEVSVYSVPVESGTKNIVFR